MAGLALAFGLAFGLGGRDTAAKIWENTYSAAQENLPKLSDGVKRQAQQTKLQAQQAANNMQPQRGPAQYLTPAGYNQATQQANYNQGNQGQIQNQGQLQNQTQMQNPPYNYPPASQSQTYPTRQATNYNYTNDQTQPPEQPGQQPPRQ